MIITVKSVIFVTILQVIVKSAYFIDISEPIGIGAIFTFLMTFFFTQDSGVIEKKIMKQGI